MLTLVVSMLLAAKDENASGGPGSPGRLNTQQDGLSAYSLPVVPAAVRAGHSSLNNKNKSANSESRSRIHEPGPAHLHFLSDLDAQQVESLTERACGQVAEQE